MSTKIKNVRLSGSKLPKSFFKKESATRTSAIRQLNRLRKQVGEGPKVISGPLLVLERVSDRQVLTMIRDAINIALAEPVPTLQNVLSTARKHDSIKTLPYDTQNWHDKQQVSRPTQSHVTKRKTKFYRPASAEGATEQKTWRARVNEWIENFVGPIGNASDDLYRKHFRSAWKAAYRQLMLRHRVDVEQRARNYTRQCIRTGVSVSAGNEPLDFIERLGLMEEFFRIVCEMYPTNNFNVDPAMRSEPVLDGAVPGQQDCCANQAVTVG